MNAALARCRCLLVAVALVQLAACLNAPVDYHASGSRHNVNAEVQRHLQPGVTMKEDVFLLLDESDQISADEQLLGYEWGKINALLFVGAYYTGGMAEIGKTYLLQIKFGEDNRVIEVGLVEHWKTR
jgi:hypothetical protein